MDQYYILLERKTVEMYMMIQNCHCIKHNKQKDTKIAGTVEVDGKQITGVTDIISHSLGSAVGQQMNNDYGNIFRRRSYGSPFVSNQRPEDTGTNLRIRKSGDIVSMFDKGSITLNKGTLDTSPEARVLRDPLQNHSYKDVGNVHNKAGSLPLTQEEFLEQFN